MIETLQRWAAQRGYRVGHGPIEVLEEARAAVAACHASGALDDRLWEEELAPLAAPGPELPGRTVVVVAAPTPAYTVGFEYPGGRLDAMVPPTYVRYRARFEEVRQDLVAHGLPGARVEHLDGPVKSVAARLGLVRYGRNNVTYAEGLGSFIQLCGFVTDASLPGGLPAQPPRLLDECESCGVCEAACPTGAISGERVLLHAERCVTYANECPGAWPGWVGEDAHSCLVGCLECQRACPANPEQPVVASGVKLPAVETAALLRAGDGAGSPGEAGISRKLAWLGLSCPPAVLARNLQALLHRRQKAAVV